MDKLDFLELYDSNHNFTGNELYNLTQTIFKDYEVVRQHIDSHGWKKKVYDIISIVTIGNKNPRLFVMEWTRSDEEWEGYTKITLKPTEVKLVEKKENITVINKDYISIDNKELICSTLAEVSYKTKKK